MSIRPTIRRRLRSCFGACVAIVALAPGIAAACSCARPTPAEALEHSAAVFTGKVVTIDLLPPEGFPFPLFAVVVEWHAYWKGELAGRVVVWTETSSAACGYSFQVGETYLIYAHANGPTYTTNLCTRTSPLYDGLIEDEGLGEPQAVGVATRGWSGFKRIYRE